MPHRLPVIVAAALGLSLGGCAHQGDGSDAFAWSFHQNEAEGAKLAFGAPHTDHVLMMMTCAPGAGRVHLSAMSGRPDRAIVLGRERFEAAATPNPFGGGYIVEAEARAADAPLARFAATGDLALRDGVRRISLAAGSGERAHVRRFFQTCGT